MNDNLFFSAALHKFRFSDPGLGGALSTEDLFGLHLEQLDAIAKQINRNVKAMEEESFINRKKKATDMIVQQLEVVKAVISYKLEQEDMKSKKAKLLAERRQLLELASNLRQQELEKSFTKAEDVLSRVQEIDDLLSD